MAIRYVIAKGELLTHPIEGPKRFGEKARPYSLEENKTVIVPRIEATSAAFDQLPPDACPQDIAVAKLTLHPTFIAKSFFPANLLRSAGLVSVGSRTRRIEPRKRATASAPEQSDTTEILVAGTRTQMRTFARFASELRDQTAEGQQFAELEDFAPMTEVDRIKSAPEEQAAAYEIALHVHPDAGAAETRGYFSEYASKLGFELVTEYEFQAGGLLFLPVRGPRQRLSQLAKFTLMRVVRPMPRIRAARPAARSTGVSVPYTPPTVPPLSDEPRVAVLDGGLPSEHSIKQYVRRYILGDEDAADVPDYLDHGLGVTSAFLFGPIEPGANAPQPFAFVDHHRVLDALSDEEDPLELYRTLGHIESVLTSRVYQFVNLSLGPDLSIDDDDVHAWTSVIDSLLSDGETLLTVAVGNNGERDKTLRLDRVQVPADSVNALSVGAVTRTSSPWDVAPYSARGPGRTPGRRKPDMVAFGGSPREYFHHAAAGTRPQLAANLGTSFAAPYVLRSAVGVRAVLGRDIHPLTIKGLLVHTSQCPDGADTEAVGWGCAASDVNEIITCPDGVARILYQGMLRPGKFLRAPVPLPDFALEGNVTLTATFCYASPVDPEDASAYTKAGLVITFRPHSGRLGEGSTPKSKSFFPSSEYRTEEEQRSDLGKWETVLHASHTFRGTRLSEPTFDIHYNARDSGGAAHGADQIPYALVLTIQAPRHTDLYERILASHAVLEALEPRVHLPIRT